MAVSKRLYRSCDDKVLGGVAGGLGEYLDIDPTLIRLVIVLSFMAGFGFLAYILAWVIIPLDPKCESKTTGAEEIKVHAERVANDFKKASKTKETTEKTNIRFWLGLAIIFLAFSILTRNIFGYNIWHNFWPIALVAAGILLITSSLDKK